MVAGNYNTRGIDFGRQALGFLEMLLHNVVVVVERHKDIQAAMMAKLMSLLIMVV